MGFWIIGTDHLMDDDEGIPRVKTPLIKPIADGADERNQAHIDAARETAKRKLAFRTELEQLINRHSQESDSGTPDFILAQYLHHCLMAFEEATAAREKWYGRAQDPRFGTPVGGFANE